MGKFTAYELPLKSLAQGTYEYEYKLGGQFFKDMESADVRDANVDVHLTLVHRGDIYDLMFKFTGEVITQCDRCLDDLHLPIDAEYHIMVKYGEAYRDDSDDTLEIPENVKELNVSYMMYDTVSLAIPIKHVHPLGKCNRAMSAILRKHRATSATDEDAELEDQLIEEMDSMPEGGDEGDNMTTDPRWNKLKDLSDNQ